MVETTNGSKGKYNQSKMHLCDCDWLPNWHTSISLQGLRVFYHCKLALWLTFWAHCLWVVDSVDFPHGNNPQCLSCDVRTARSVKFQKHKNNNKNKTWKKLVRRHFPESMNTRQYLFVLRWHDSDRQQIINSQIHWSTYEICESDLKDIAGDFLYFSYCHKCHVESQTNKQLILLTSIVCHPLHIQSLIYRTIVCLETAPRTNNSDHVFSL